MNEYKKVIEEFLENIEKLDTDIIDSFDDLSERYIYLLSIIRACRNKLIDIIDTYNCLGDDYWKLPDLQWK